MTDYGSQVRRGTGASMIPVTRSGTHQMMVEVDNPLASSSHNVLVVRGAQYAENNGAFPILDRDDAGVYIASPKGAGRPDYAAEWEEHEPLGEVTHKVAVEGDNTEIVFRAPDVRSAVTKKEEKRSFARGDVVQLKSGGPYMTVDRVTSDDVRCIWFTHHQATVPNYANFHPDLLSLKNGS